jgi:hypothetical protein
MLPFFDVGEDARGVIAIGQMATGVVAIGQVATGVIAIGQFSRGVIAIGQFSIGVFAVGMFAGGLFMGVGAGIAPRFIGAGFSMFPGARARVAVPALRRLGEIATGSMDWVRLHFRRLHDDRLEVSENRVPVLAHIREPLATNAKLRVHNEAKDLFAHVTRAHDGSFVIGRIRETGEPTAAAHATRRAHWFFGTLLYVVLVTVYFFFVARPLGELFAEIF